MKQKYLKLRNKSVITVIILVTLFIFSPSDFAQSIMTAQDAVKIALENNYSIKIAENQKTISDNNETIGNAGLLPNLDASASYNRSSNNTKQNFSNGTVVDRTGAISKNYAAEINLSWTIFDGLKMFASLDQLKELKKTGETNYKITVEQNISDVLSSFYDIVRQELLLEVIKKNISISEERLKIVQNEKEVGAASKFDLLKAQVDLNTDKSSLLNQQEQLAEARVKLNMLLGRDINTGFEVEKDIEINQGLSYDDLKPVAEKNNSELLLALQNKNISELQLRLERSELYPKISFNIGYNYTKSASDAGF
ncbi:MAG: transporter, partial [Ignavibacteriales bacterium CG_4_9_14_3_um_filter_30_11]